jgi:uncharacterized membrane protein YdjX (TVP38/TMEM64 family)
MNDWARLVATLVIWGALAGILTSVNSFMTDLTSLAVVLTIGATISTTMVWGAGRMSGQHDAEQVRKAKRNGRISRLVDKLDDDDVVQLEELLAARHDSEFETRD